MNNILIFYYDVIDDYVFCEIVDIKYMNKTLWLHRFFHFNEDGETVTTLAYSPRMKFICEVI